MLGTNLQNPGRTAWAQRGMTLLIALLLLGLPIQASCLCCTPQESPTLVSETDSSGCCSLEERAVVSSADCCDTKNSASSSCAHHSQWAPCACSTQSTALQQPVLLPSKIEVEKPRFDSAPLQLAHTVQPAGVSTQYATHEPALLGRSSSVPVYTQLCVFLT